MVLNKIPQGASLEHMKLFATKSVIAADLPDPLPKRFHQYQLYHQPSKTEFIFIKGLKLVELAQPISGRNTILSPLLDIHRSILESRNRKSDYLRLSLIFELQKDIDLYKKTLADKLQKLLF